MNEAEESVFEGAIVRLAAMVESAFTRLDRLNESIQKLYIDKWWFIVAALGAVFVVLNTLHLSFSRHVNSDTIAQQLIVNQWIGGVDPTFATLGETNYLIKFPIYVLMEALPIDPYLRLVLTALVFALAAWGIIVYASSKIASLLKFTDSQKYIFGWLLLFVSAVSIHVVWLHYPNSRTIEIGLMLGVLYWLLRLYTLPASFLTIILFSLATGVLFISDKHALYTVGMMSGIYFAIKAIQGASSSRRDEIAAALRPLCGLVGAALVFVVGVLIIKSKLLPINIQQIVDGRLATADEAFYMIPEAIAGLLELHGVYIFGQQLFTLDMVLSVIYGLALGLVGYLAFSKKARRFSVASGLFMSVAIGTVVLFAIGNRATDASSGRYLILVPFLLITAAAMAIVRQKNTINLLVVSSVALVAIVTLPVIGQKVIKGATERQWVASNQSTYNTIDAVKSRGATKGYDTFFSAQATTYLSDGEVLSIPVRCESGQTHPVQLLLEAASIYLPAEKSYIHVTADSGSTVCSESDISLQFGAPSSTEVMPDGSAILFYDRDITSELKHPVM